MLLAMLMFLGNKHKLNSVQILLYNFISFFILGINMTWSFLHNIQSEKKKKETACLMLNFSSSVVRLEEAGAEEAETVETAAEEDVAAEAPEVLLETAKATREETGTLETVVEKVAETVAETAEVVAEVAEVVAETAEEVAAVAAVAEEVQKVAEEVEAAAEAVVIPVIQAEEPMSESNGTPAASAEEAVAEATGTEA